AAWALRPAFCPSGPPPARRPRRTGPLVGRPLCDRRSPAHRRPGRAHDRRATWRRGAGPARRRDRPVRGADFRCLIERARAAHDLEVERLRLEVRALRAELLAARGAAAPAAPCSARVPCADEAGDGRGGAEPRAPSFEPLGAGAAALPPRAAERRLGPGGLPEDSPDAQGPVAASWSPPSDRRGRGRASPRRPKLRHGRDTLRERSASRQEGRLRRLVTSTAFEVAVGVAIILNGVLMCVEAQYDAFGLAEDVGHVSVRDAQVWPHASDVFGAFDLIFGLVFLVEVILKIVALRSQFVLDAWNWIDLTIVLLWLYTRVSQLGVNAQFLRLARLARMFRLLRIVKFMQSQLTESLFLMSTALAGSVMTTAWTFLLFFVVHTILALFINQTLTEFYFEAEPSNPEEQRQVFLYFGSFTRAFLTMFEITFDNWSNGVRALVDNVSVAFLLYAVLHKIIIGFAAVGVLGAIFIQETFRVAEMDDNLVVRQQTRKESVHCDKMQRLFNEADIDGDGSIDIEEWMQVCNDTWVQVWLRAQELKAQDAHSLFGMLDDGDGRLTADELISGTAGLKGASAIIQILDLIRGTSACTSEIRAELLFTQLATAEERRAGDCGL
ncbi:unnamed protein product, partial [Prorocentrum cordatum]